MDSQFDYIWNSFLKRVEAEIDRTSQADVARRLGVNRGQVSKWLSGLQVGGNLKTFLTHLEKLEIPLNQLTNPNYQSPPPTSQSTQWKPSLYEIHLAATLQSGAKLLGKSVQSIYAHAYGDSSHVPLSHVQAMLQGKAQMGVEDFYKLCKSIGLLPSDVLDRVAKLAEENGAKKGAPRRRTA
ncbi:helix-turn-helix domain-containing protein [Desulfovibrio psychrotolerans]|uniref:HTH cro/C1-type domain-containing protein n=1 Tax=Desulfovibrio psychrotolerans TaxID=415242 RepID=A0A7J0BX48_9BACT|nr:helix-turn-helix domain-containing protein [Desulfovibrio psychrotolerans]GFM38289.1 hypothetical protein DSM19430T_29730 [Desulfovibrio psychrotolerans]